MFNAFALASCGSKPVRISADYCWSVSVGDRVEGTAILFANSDDDCIECGASVSGGPNCSGVGLAIVSGEVKQIYNRMVQSAPAGNLGYVTQVVFLSGDVIANGATGRPMILATHLRLATTKGS